MENKNVQSQSSCYRIHGGVIHERSIKDSAKNPQMAKANNLKPYDYFEYLLTELPKHADDTKRNFLASLLPWSETLP